MEDFNMKMIQKTTYIDVPTDRLKELLSTTPVENIIKIQRAEDPFEILFHVEINNESEC